MAFGKKSRSHTGLKLGLRLSLLNYIFPSHLRRSYRWAYGGRRMDWATPVPPGPDRGPVVAQHGLTRLTVAHGAGGGQSGLMKDCYEYCENCNVSADLVVKCETRCRYFTTTGFPQCLWNVALTDWKRREPFCEVDDVLQV